MLFPSPSSIRLQPDAQLASSGFASHRWNLICEEPALKLSSLLLLARLRLPLPSYWWRQLRAIASQLRKGSFFDPHELWINPGRHFSTLCACMSPMCMQGALLSKHDTVHTNICLQCRMALRSAPFSSCKRAGEPLGTIVL